jgi:uncharacterized membrane protein YfcA
MIEFPVSGVETYWWVPLTVAFVISTFTSMGGVSGAFLLLPFQVSILGFAGPAVSPTNLVYNVVAIPSGVYRYYREGRMVWPLTWTVLVGTIPGVFLGAIIRIEYLPDPRAFKLFAGLVLLYLGVKLLSELIRNRISRDNIRPGNQRSSVRTLMFTTRKISYEFCDSTYHASTVGLFALSLVVGVVGGVYGIGGGAIIAPFLVAVFGLPVYTVAGAALMATFVSSIAGVLFYTMLAEFYGSAVQPDFALGALFGLGGMAGMYVGAAMQRHVPARTIKIVLSACILFVAARYVFGFFF